MLFFFFKQKTAYEMRISDWSSDVCSSDLVLSLGCQNAQISLLKEEISRRIPEYDRPLYFLEQQQMGTEKKMLSKALKLTYTGMIRANEQKRKPAPISKLCLGMECGGSDGFSGISANPAVGMVDDKLIAGGGSVIRTEFPEDRKSTR